MNSNPYESPDEAGLPLVPQWIHTVSTAALTLSILMAGSLIILVGPFAWLLRDGLGPDSTQSTGWSAAYRMFWAFYWGPITLGAGLLVVLAIVFQRRLRKAL